MTDIKNLQYNDLGIWNECEERASWLLKSNGGKVVFKLTEYTDVESLTRIIYQREVALRESNEKSLFERQNVIPNKELPIDET